MGQNMSLSIELHTNHMTFDKFTKLVTSASSQMEWNDSSMIVIFKVLFYSNYVYMGVCLYVGMCTLVQVRMKPEEGVQSPGARVPGGCELLDVGARY